MGMGQPRGLYTEITVSMEVKRNPATEHKARLRPSFVAAWACVCRRNRQPIPIPIRNMEKDILKIAGFSAFSKYPFP